MIDLDANVREYDTFIRRLVRGDDRRMPVTSTLPVSPVTKNTALVFIGPTQIELTGP
jgi:hypothetical protein